MKKARAAYSSGDYEKARTHFEPAAASGNIIASYYLGNMYRLGRGVERISTIKSLHYYQDVADAFTPEEPDPHRLRIMIDALVRVADIYREGDVAEGVEPNSNDGVSALHHRGLVRPSFRPLCAGPDVAFRQGCESEPGQSAAMADAGGQAAVSLPPKRCSAISTGRAMW